MTDYSQVTESTKPTKSAAKKPFWMIYVAAIFGGTLMLADALGFAPLQRVTAKLAIALIYSAFVLMIGKGKKVAIIAAAIIWASVIATFIW